MLKLALFAGGLGLGATLAQLAPAELDALTIASKAGPAGVLIVWAELRARPLLLRVVADLDELRDSLSALRDKVRMVDELPDSLSALRDKVRMVRDAVRELRDSQTTTTTQPPA